MNRSQMQVGVPVGTGHWLELEPDGWEAMRTRWAMVLRLYGPHGRMVGRETGLTAPENDPWKTLISGLSFLDAWFEAQNYGGFENRNLFGEEFAVLDSDDVEAVPRSLVSVGCGHCGEPFHVPTAWTSGQVPCPKCKLGVADLDWHYRHAPWCVWCGEEDCEKHVAV